MAEDQTNQGEKNEQTAGAAGLVTIADRNYLASPPTDQDFGTLHNHLRRKLKNPVAAIAEDLEGLPPHVQQAAIRAAVELKAGGGAAMTSEFVSQELAKPEGCALLAWLLIRKNHPEVTLEAIKAGIPDDQTAARVLSELGEAAGTLAGNRSGRPA